MKNLILASLFLFCSFCQKNYAQEIPKAPEKYTAHNKGKFFVNYGGNRDYYTKSDITFKGDNYNFTIYDVKASDKPKGWHIDYVNPVKLFNPQTNFRMGYFFTDKYSFSISFDHMKYVMIQNQTVNMTGEINLPATEAGSAYNGVYTNEPMVMTENFLEFENTNGLNFINAEITRLDDVTKIFGWNTDKVQLNTVLGGGLGLLYPKTDATLLGKASHDDFHVSGYGIDIKTGLNLTFFKYFFIQSEIKGGYINMQDIRTTKSTSDSASQHFGFLQTNIAFGGIFRI